MIGQWVKSKNVYCTPGGDPVWECNQCGGGEHVYGIETMYGFKRYCPDCGSENKYPWEIEIDTIAEEI